MSQPPLGSSHDEDAHEERSNHVDGDDCQREVAMSEHAHDSNAGQIPERCADGPAKGYKRKGCQHAGSVARSLRDVKQSPIALLHGPPTL